MSPVDIVNKLWNYCNVLRDDGMSYGDYPGSSPGQANNEQLTYLLFLKMADERAFLGKKAPYNQNSPVTEKYSWPPSPRPSPTSGRGGLDCDSDVPFDHYRRNRVHNKGMKCPPHSLT
jgi:type I restriction enzyme M protein